MDISIFWFTEWQRVVLIRQLSLGAGHLHRLQEEEEGEEEEEEGHKYKNGGYKQRTKRGVAYPLQATV